MNKYSISILLLFLLTVSEKVISQKRDSSIHYPTNHYTLLSVGLTHSTYRDFATSPLFYSGLGLDLNAAWLKRADKKEGIFEIGLGISAHSPRVPQGININPVELSVLAHLSLFNK